MISETEVVVIGSGALGSSVAFHLAKARKLAVALVDMHDLASQTSPRAAGLTSQVRRSELMTGLARLAVRKIETFTKDTGEPLTYHQPGALKIARLPEHEAQLEAEVARGRRLGVELDFISLEEARRKMPFLETRGIRAVTFSPTDLYLEPAQIPVGYSRAAGKLGAAMLPHTRVDAITVKDGAVKGVSTDKGEISCRFVVDAAGAWTRQVASLASSSVPMVPTRHQLLITEPIDGVEPNQPITRIIDANVYVRPDNGGLMLGGYEKKPIQYDMTRLAPSFDIKDMKLDLEVLRALAESVREQLPVFARLGRGSCASRASGRAADDDGRRRACGGSRARGARAFHRGRMLRGRAFDRARGRRGAGRMDPLGPRTHGSVGAGAWTRERRPSPRGAIEGGVPRPIFPPLLGAA